VVAAGPWEGDEVGELLYWIPFLRWAAATSAEIAERLVTVVRPDRREWYAGLPGRLVTEAPDEGVPLDPAAVEAARGELAQQDPFVRLRQRTLEFAPLTVATEPYTGPFGAGAVLALLSGHPAHVPDVAGHEADAALAGRLAAGPGRYGQLHVGMREPAHA